MASPLPSKRLEHKDGGFKPNFNVAHAMRGMFRSGYSFAKFRSDLMAGITVGIVALPLSMALAIASGVPPQYGLYTAIVAGGLAAALGGSDVNITGPTAAFVVLLIPVSQKFGLAGLLIASLMSGVILLIMGIARLGRLIEFIPHPVMTGFTAGIGVTIALGQLKDVFGLTFPLDAETGAQILPESFIQRVTLTFNAMPAMRWQELVVGVTTLAILLLWPRVTRRIPAPLIAVSVMAGLVYLLGQVLHVQAFEEIVTIGSRFRPIINGVEVRGIPQLPPLPALPWEMAGPHGQPFVADFATIEALIPAAFAIAMLGAIESLLCAVVADGMAGTKHDPDSELLGLGIGNIVAPFFGGFAATGAIARTATGIRFGTKSPMTGIIHALFVLAAVLTLAPVLAYLPMASMAALLILVAYNMSDVKHFVHMVKVAPKSDLAVLLACFTLTVVFDMVIAVGVGMVLAAMLFMKRMADLSHTRLAEHESSRLSVPLPPGTIMYEIAGPLFFGAAQKAMSTLDTVARKNLKVVLNMTAVPVMDVTGLVALESTLKKLIKGGTYVVLAGVQRQPARVLDKGEIHEVEGKLRIFHSLDEAVAHLRSLDAPKPPPPQIGAPEPQRPAA